MVLQEYRCHHDNWKTHTLPHFWDFFLVVTWVDLLGPVRMKMEIRRMEN